MNKTFLLIFVLALFLSVSSCFNWRNLNPFAPSVPQRHFLVAPFYDYPISITITAILLGLSVLFVFVPRFREIVSKGLKVLLKQFGTRSSPSGIIKPILIFFALATIVVVVAPYIFSLKNGATPVAAKPSLPEAPKSIPRTPITTPASPATNPAAKPHTGAAPVKSAAIPVELGASAALLAFVTVLATIL